MGSCIRAFLLALLAFAAFVDRAGGVPILVDDPGFDAYLHGTVTPIPDDRVTLGGSGPATNATMVLATEFVVAEETADIPEGWTTGGTSFRFRHDDEFDNPSGSLLILDSSAGGAAALQTVAPSVLANTTYTATIEVYDRNSESVFGGDLTFIADDISMLLVADFLGDNHTVLDSTFTFTPPGNGGNSTYTLTAVTDGTPPVGALAVYIAVSGHPGGPGTATQTGFDNFTLDAATTPPSGDADFDLDGDVDGADFLLWQRGGSPNQLSASDLDLWKAQFGAPAVAASAPIPEPASGALGIVAFFGTIAAFRKARSRNFSV